MSRRVLIVVLTMIAACSRPATPLTEVLPEHIGDWARGPVRETSDVPPLVQQLGLESAAETTYSGTAEVRVRIFRMRAESSAFELIQKWRQADSPAVYKGAYFLIADAPDPTAAHDVLKRLQSEIK